MDWDKARLFNDKALGQNEEGEVRQDRIIGRGYNERKKAGRERTCNEPW